MGETYIAALTWLYSLERLGWKLGLERVRDCLDQLGNPQKNYKIVHVAGTNGKGSVCAMTAKVLETGFKVGMNTSPHLISFRERIQINGKYISEEEILELIDLIKQTSVELTFFEFVTVMALQYFSAQGCDYVVLETGMGGRLDASNVCYPEVSVITTIGIDHTKWLGNSIEEIAGEKAGIIKGGGKVIVGKGIKGLDVISTVCTQKNASLQEASLYSGEIGLWGEFQSQNAGVVFAVCKELGIDEEVIADGIAGASWPGRLEFLDDGVLVDCAHNVDGMEALGKHIFSIRKQYQNLIVVFGCQQNKDFSKMLSFLPEPDVLILTQSKVRGGIDPAVLKNEFPGFVIENPSEAFKHAVDVKQAKDLVLVCGSCYVVGNILEDLNNSSDGWKLAETNKSL